MRGRLGTPELMAGRDRLAPTFFHRDFYARIAALCDEVRVL